jgi:hypothetical protein
MSAPICGCGRQTIRRASGWWCSWCHRTAKPRRRRQSDQANREKVAEGQRRYYQANREKVAEGQRRYYQANREKLAEGQRRYRQANREKVAERKRRYRQANRRPVQPVCAECGAALRYGGRGRPPKWCAAHTPRQRGRTAAVTR